MDRLSQLRGEAGTSRDSTLDTSSPPSETYMTANETSSKYFSLSDVDSTFDITPIKDVSSTIDTERTITESDRLISNLSPIGKKNDFLDSYKIGKQIEAANILSGGVDIFDDNDNSYDGDELVIDDNVECEDKSNLEMKLAGSPVKEIESTESNLVEAEPVLRKDTTEVTLQIDGKNVDAIDIGNGLYLYRRQGEEELAAVQIDENQHQPNYKFLKVRENEEGNLEVYEEFQVEVPKEVPVQEGSSSEASASHVPSRDISEVTCSKVTERKAITQSETSMVTSNNEKDANKDISDTKSDANGKLMKFCESRKSPVVGSFTPMTYHSTPNKEGIPLTKTMVDLQLHPNRHSDNVKKTIEVHTDCAKPKVDQVKLTKENEDNIKQDKHKIDSKADCEQEQDNKNKEKFDTSAKKYKSEEVVKIDKVTSNINESKKDEKQQSDDLPNLNIDKEMDDKSMKISPEPAVVKLTPASIQQTSGIVTTDKLHEENSEMLIFASDANQISKISAKEQALEIPINKTLNEAGSKSIVDTYSTQQISEQLILQQSKVAAPKKSKEVEKKQISGKSEQQQESKGATTKKLNQDDSFTKVHTHITNQISEQLTQQQSIKVASSKKSIKKETNTVANTQMTNNEISNQLTQEQVSKVAATEKLNEEDLKRVTVNADDTSQIVKLATKQQATETVSDRKLNEPDSVTGVSTKYANQISKDIVSQNIKLVKEGIIPSSDKNMLKTDVVPSNLKNDECRVENECRSTTKEISSFREDNIESAINKAEEDVADRALKAGDKKIEQENAKHDVGNNNKESPVLLENEKNLIVKEDTKGATNIKIENKNITREENNEKDQLATDVQPVNEVTDSKSHTRHENISKPSDGKKSTLQTVDSEDKVTLLSKESKAIADSTTTKTVETKPSRKMDPQMELGSVTDIKKNEIGNKSLKPTLIHVAQSKDSTMTSKKTLLKVNEVSDQKPISNNHAPVPFGKWTEANRQAFLIKIKETKVPSNSSNGKQIKNSNDLNRRDVLKKIDSHRQTHTNIPSAKVQDFGCSNRLPIKKEASVFSSKPTQDSKPPVKTEASLLATNAIIGKKLVKQETSSKPQADSSNLTVEPTAVNKKEQLQRKEINNQDLIDKTIEDIISRDLPLKSQADNGNDVMTETLDALQSTEEFDAIEKRMNELHGIGNIERSANSLLHHSGQKTLIKPDVQQLACNKPSKIPNLLPFTNKSQRKGVKENIIDVDSEDEVIDHEPITGDMDLSKKQATKLPEKQEQIGTDISKKEGITEKDFDKFVRRNSVTYENCITVNFDSNEHVVQKDVVLRTYSKNEPHDNNVGSPKQDLHKQGTAAKPTQTVLKAAIEQNEEINKNYPSKVKMAYQSAMTVKRQLERPITIIEDKPVKVVYMDSCAEFIPMQLNAQGKELSPAKKQSSSIDLCNTSTNDSLDSDILELDDGKLSTETKSKTKHQRKQVLTPVETPELELIEPGDLGLEVSPKKKRKVEEKVENSPKPVVPKKSYLLGRGATADNEVIKPQESAKSFATEQTNVNKFEISHISHNNTASAIDNLVKAAELLETQSESLNQDSTIAPDADNQQKTPVKRGRGRPRKYPLPEGDTDKVKIQTPQKKPRLSDTKMFKSKDTDEDVDDDDDDSGSDGEMIRENWTMGKINENIVCPICNKLFRSENVVFKHVKHCTGPSPNRSDSGSKSPRRFRDSQDYESKSADDKINEEVDDKESTPKDIRKKRKSRETTLKAMSYKDESISVEGTVSKSKLEGAKHEETKKSTLTKNKITDHKTNNLVCEFCGKTFRQLSYLVNHKLQHEKEEAKNHETETKSSKSVFSCEVCKKEFRKLHHLVQHRLIHNSSSVSSAKLLRKSSAERNENRTSKDQDMAKQSDDTSAGFRCEPCDKSFRKLHHLVEHRETHDGINRQKNPTVSAPVEKAPPPPQCEICKKTFRKLHHLIEHKEQHLETSSEKSDDKSIKSSLSTKDIIHECSLCYMVFPNEHSLNKHTIICQRKKRQSATKQNKLSKEEDQVDENKSTDKTDDDMDNENEVIIVSTEIMSDRQSVQNIPVEDSQIKDESKVDAIPPMVVANIDISTESPSTNVTEQSKDLNTVKEPEDIVQKVIPDVPQIQEKKEEKVCLKVKETTKKKADKLAPSITKRQKPNNTLPVVNDGKSVESSDDDEIRYMINPDYKMDDNVKAKVFMNIRSNKRNSLQIERPNSKDLVKRRISLQNPAKVPRLKPKLVQSKATTAGATAVTKNLAKTATIEAATDSDDSDVKYSFPKITKANTEETNKITKETEKKLPRQSLTEKRKSLSTIAKRKSLGKTLSVKHKAKPSPVKPIKQRLAEAAHRCDCGQLFSSAALLSRHTVLAHTPPRVRRRRSPPPDPPAKPPKPTKPRVSTTRKSSAKTEPDVRATPKNPEPRKSIKTSETVKSGVTNTKVKRLAAHSGVPVPEKMKKLMEKFKK